MWNKPNKQDLAVVPKLYANEKAGTGIKETIIYLHFFIAGYDWYVAEYDGDDIFFGFANLHDPINAEWGLISFDQLKIINMGGVEVDRDLHWRVRKAMEVKEIKKCQRHW